MDFNIKFNLSQFTPRLAVLIFVFFNCWTHFIDLLNMLINLLDSELIFYAFSNI